MANVVQPRVTDVIAKSLLTTKGDIIQFSGTIPERLGIGTDYQIPRRDAASDKLAYVYEGKRISELYNSSKNAAGATLNPGDTLTTIDLGTVSIGDIFLAIGNAYVTPDQINSVFDLIIGKSSGTATLTMLHDATTATSGVLQTSNGSRIDANITSIIKITGAGTLVLKLYCDSDPGDGTYTLLANKAQFVCIPLYIQG